MPISSLFIPVVLYYILAVFIIWEFCQFPSFFLGFTGTCIFLGLWQSVWEQPGLVEWWDRSQHRGLWQWAPTHLPGLFQSISSSSLCFQLVLLFAALYPCYSVALCFPSSIKQRMSPGEIMHQIFFPCLSSTCKVVSGCHQWGTLLWSEILHISAGSWESWLPTLPSDTEF